MILLSLSGIMSVMKMLRLAIITFLIGLTFPTTLLSADLDEGLDALRRGDYDAALVELRPFAEQGNASAQNAIGFMYSKGHGVRQDHVEAVIWYRKAADQGHAHAQTNLGLKYAHGQGVQRDYAEAVRWYRKAVKQDNARAQNNLGLLYLNGIGVQRNYAEAARLFRKAAEQGTSVAQNNLGDMYYEGLGVRQDYAEAAKWYRKASEQDHMDAQNNLGLMYQAGNGVQRNYAEAIKLFRRAAQQDYSLAQYNIGFMYEGGFGVRQDYATALKWYGRAAEQDYALAQYNIGVYYSQGWGVEQDYGQAIKWYLKAAEQNYALAQNNLGVSYEQGLGAEQDYVQAVKWYRKAAEQGLVLGQFNLGASYNYGRGVEQDYGQAIKWYLKAAEQDSAPAQTNLGLMHFKGKGVRQNYTKALRWFRLAANQGQPSAQTSLGAMYARGLGGLKKNYGEAARWYRKAAKQGSAIAQTNLGDLYARGLGVRQDYIQAYKWYDLAAAQNNENASKSRRKIAARMSPTQVSKAQRLSRVWKLGSQSLTKDPLLKYSAPSSLTAAQEKNRRVQMRLATLGYNPGPADGIVGPKTREAIRAFQGREGLKVTGTISPVLFDALTAATVGSTGSKSETKKPVLELTSSGSGFYVSKTGHILTNEHVVRGCRELRTPPSFQFAVVALEKRTDLALLTSTGQTKRLIAKFRGGRGIRSGDDIVILGYPLPGVLASEVNVTSGTVSALAGPGDDRRFFQITAPVQPGNSGGPVLDRAGNAVGVVRAKLDAIKVARATGDIPQNVNFAVSAGTVRSFLDAHDVPYETAASTDKLEPADIAANARKFTVPIECWK